MRSILGTMVAVALMGFGVPANADDSADDRLEQRVENRIGKDTRLRDGKIEVDVDERVATLKGRVSTRADKSRAEKLARVSGVKRVDNQIEVDADMRKVHVDNDGNLIDHDLRDGKVRDTTKSGSNELGSEVGDTWITTKVKASFVGEDALRGSDISVDTNQDGVVTLTGTVPSEAARARAISIVRDTKGVRKINDQMKMAVDRK